MVWSAVYSSFGEATVEIETVENNLRFPGQYFDSETGLHYNFHRYYDPSPGRYLTPDQIGLDGGVNLFIYVLNNSIMHADPTGLIKPLPPNKTRLRDCNPDEYKSCSNMCGSKGVESCKVSQTWRVIERRERLTVWGRVDSPMSCSCDDPDEEFCGEGCRKVLKVVSDVATEMLTIMIIIVCSQTPAFS